MTQQETIASFLHVLPSFKMAFIGRASDTLLALFDEALKPVDGELNAFIYEDAVLDFETVKLTTMANYQKIFRTVAREYELLVLHNICHVIENQERLFKTAFKALENSGDLLIIENNLEGIQEALELVGFVAVNEIEHDGASHLLSAKKMHGWGHGL